LQQKSSKIFTERKRREISPSGDRKEMERTSRRAKHYKDKAKQLSEAHSASVEKLSDVNRARYEAKKRSLALKKFLQREAMNKLKMAKELQMPMPPRIGPNQETQLFQDMDSFTNYTNDFMKHLPTAEEQASLNKNETLLDNYGKELEIWEQKMMSEKRWAELYVLSSEARRQRISFPEEVAAIVKRKLHLFEQLKEVYEDLQKLQK